MGIYFALYERARLLLRQDNGGLLSNLGTDLVCGAVSATAAAGLTCPLVSACIGNSKDVVKTRIQTQTAESSYQYANSLDAMQQIFRKEGVPGFFRGLSARILWMAPSSALGIASYQAFKDLLQG